MTSFLHSTSFSANNDEIVILPSCDGVWPGLGLGVFVESLVVKLQPHKQAASKLRRSCD